MSKRKDLEIAYSKGNFICNICKNELPLKEFGSHKHSNKYGISSKCKKYSRERDKFSKIKRIYNLTEENFQELYDSQDGKCKICSCEVNYRGNSSNKVNSACIDHNHITGKVRGLLCSNCNRALGLFKDDKLIVSNAYKYLNDE